MVEAYVTVHDQSLIAECEVHRRFEDVSHTYLFVGPRPVDHVPKHVKLIVARDYDPNFEHWPHFYDFTGWYVLARHGLITAARIITLQYDMRVTDPHIVNTVNKSLDHHVMSAFTAGHNSAHNFMLLINGFEQTYLAGMSLKGVNPGAWPLFEEWPSTQGTAWRTDAFVEFMLWFEPLFEQFAPDMWAGHLAERCVKAWLVSNGYVEGYVSGIVHDHHDCHGTCARMAGQTEVADAKAATFGR